MSEIFIKNKDLWNRLNISKNTFYNRRKEINNLLRTVDSVKIIKKGIFIDEDDVNRIPPIGRKKRRLTVDYAEREEFFKERIVKAVKKNPIITGTMLANEAYDEFEEDLGLAPSTLENYFRVYIQKFFGKGANNSGEIGYSTDERWVMFDRRLGDYRRMTDEEIDTFLKILDKNMKQAKEALIEYIKQIGNINSVNMKAIMKIKERYSYAQMKKEFYCIRDGYPLKIPERFLF